MSDIPDRVEGIWVNPALGKPVRNALGCIEVVRGLKHLAQVQTKLI